VKGMIAHRKKLLADAAECATVRDQAIDRAKRELFALLAEQLNRLAGEVQQAITAKTKHL
jgi:hypothetical protein